ncbi:hypothetical protein WDU94_015476 [Cyamophila willieti]
MKDLRKMDEKALLEEYNRFIDSLNEVKQDDPVVPRIVNPYIRPPGTMALRASNRPIPEPIFGENHPILSMITKRRMIYGDNMERPNCCCRTCIQYPMKLVESFCPSCMSLLFRCPDCDGIRTCNVCFPHAKLPKLYCLAYQQNIKKAERKSLLEELKQAEKEESITKVREERAQHIKERLERKMKNKSKKKGRKMSANEKKRIVQRIKKQIRKEWKNKSANEKKRIVQRIKKQIKKERKKKSANVKKRIVQRIKKQIKKEWKKKSANEKKRIVQRIKKHIKKERKKKVGQCKEKNCPTN